MLIELLLHKKSSIVGNWTQLILDTYASEASKFLKSERNQFSNPVGHTIINNAERIFDEITGNQDYEIINSLLDDIIKIRAIQEFSPSQAVKFIFLLKKVIHNELEEELKDKKIVDEFLDFELMIDRIALIVFDLYSESREKVYRIRINELKSNSLTRQS